LNELILGVFHFHVEFFHGALRIRNNHIRETT